MFYAEGAGIIAQGKDQSRTGRITQAISYLVFYKTLTKVITNFNASSAGFSFESFLAALVEGQQIQTGEGTIADYTDNLGTRTDGSSGGPIPVSLKLYTDKGLQVDGSYSDLVGDLTEPQYNHPLGPAMRYVICTKKLEGRNLEQEGEIKFWQFDFTLDNVMWILANSKEKSAECIRIPQEVVSMITGKGAQASPEQYENILRLPNKSALPSADEVFKELYAPKFKQHLGHLRGKSAWLPFVLRSDREVESFLTALNWVKNDALFRDEAIEIEHAEDQPETPTPGEKPVVQTEYKPKTRGLARMHFEKTKAWATKWAEALWQELQEDPQKNPKLFKVLKINSKNSRGEDRSDADRAKAIASLGRDVATVITHANNKTKNFGRGNKRPENYNAMTSTDDGVLGILRASEIEAERKAMIKAVLDAEGGFLSPTASAKFYGSQPVEYKPTILKHTLGYLTTMHFSMNQTQATDKTAPGEVKYDKAKGEDIKVSGGSGAVYLGEIKVGAKYVAEAMQGVRDILNEEILEIFDSLKELSDSLNHFFAGGLEKDSHANKAVDNANNITSKEVLDRPRS